MLNLCSHGVEFGPGPHRGEIESARRCIDRIDTQLGPTLRALVGGDEGADNLAEGVEGVVVEGRTPNAEL